MSTTPTDSELPPIPADAIEVEEDYYMVPAGADADGTARFSAFSQRKMVAAVIFYRKADGSFTPNKALAAGG
jgi:hypothetical protein